MASLKGEQRRKQQSHLRRAPVGGRKTKRVQGLGNKGKKILKATVVSTAMCCRGQTRRAEKIPLDAATRRHW